jgi:hypothetical protein
MSMSSLADRYVRWEERQKKANRQFKYVPGLRNMFLFFSLGLAPAFAVVAMISSNANDLIYSYKFVVAFLPAFAWGLLVIIDKGLRLGAAYLAIGFITMGTVLRQIGGDPENGQIGWGIVLGWLCGMAAISCVMWLRLRKEWNQKNPDDRC